MSEVLNNYVKDCLLTESKLEKLEINPQLVDKLFTMYIELTEILDGMKKQVFYKKDEKLIKEFFDRMKIINVLSSQLLYPDGQNMFDVYGCDRNSRMFHGILGVMTEAGELAQVWRKHQHGDEFDAVNVQEELGDHHWYHSIINDELNLNPEETLHKNIRKLAKRYPDKKFSTLHAVERNLDVERNELES